MLVKHLLDRKSGGVKTIPGALSVTEAVSELAARRIGVLVVSETGDTVDGILSERDIIRGLAAQGAAVLSQPVSSLMTAHVICCVSDDTVTSVLSKMSAGNFRHMPVLKDGMLEGILSLRDLMSARAAMVEAENTALTDMISGY